MSELPNGLKGYSEEVSTVLSFMPDWIDQDEFDDLALKANLFGVDRSKPTNVRAWNEGDYILWTANSPGPYFEAIGLVQAMMQHKMVQARKRAGKVQYRAKKP